MVSILAFIVVLGITITIHEFGHFAVAKLLKIRVLVFSLGMGPRLFGFFRGGTDYRLSAIPMGGYVKMAGETFDEERQGSPDEFQSHPRWHRFLVAIAGPCMNIALAVAILTYSYIDGVQVPRYFKEPPIVGPVAENSIAHRAGLRSGDLIVSVSGNAVRTWDDMEIALATVRKDNIEMAVERNREKLRLGFEEPKDETPRPSTLGFRPTLPRTIVSALTPDSPAQKAGLKEGDEILSVRRNGLYGKGYDEILNIISASKGVPLQFEVLRQGQVLNLTITPIEEHGQTVIGFFADVPKDLEKYGLVEAVGRSVKRSYEISVLTFKIIGRILSGSASVRTLSGPIEIARISGSAARTGRPEIFFGLLGMVSLQLGIFNLLPIPILDGGVIALLLVEGLMRRDLSVAIKEKIVHIGFVFLVLLMGFALFNDLSKIVNFEKLFR